MKSGVLARGKAAPDEARLDSALHARNMAIHEHNVPSERECSEHVRTLDKVWRTLRRMYVTRENASILADALLDEDGVTDVFLFGSLARKSRDPKDIDLLLYDDGQMSALGVDYWDPELVVDEILPETAAHLAAIQCGWLDCVPVDGGRFGKEPDYTRKLAERQMDPLFFLNIAESLRSYDRSTQAWNSTRPQVFERLANLRRLLATEHIVSPNAMEK